MDLQNKLLAKQIELLEKSQEYRCCPAPVSDGGEYPSRRAGRESVRRSYLCP